MGGEVTFTVGVIPTRDKESLPALPLLETPQVKGGGVNGYVLERLDIETWEKLDRLYRTHFAEPFCLWASKSTSFW